VSDTRRMFRDNLGSNEGLRPLVAPAYQEASRLADALERTDQALRAVLEGKPLRDADEILAANAFLLFASPLEQAR